jgi:FMN-dependent NADH-azoreductase
MNLLAVVGSPRKGKATDTLVDKAIAGVTSKAPHGRIKKINLIEHNIQFCTNCLACRDSGTEAAVANCTLHDDMDAIKADLLLSDALIFGTPVHMGYVTAPMMAFLERICWTFAKPEGKFLSIHGCPIPRSNKPRKAIIIITSGIVPPMFRRFCDDATRLIKQTVKDSLNARTVGHMYAGDIEHRGVAYYFDKAFKLGQRLG